jgi:Domain of unknown function (DUF4331)
MLKTQSAVMTLSAIIAIQCAWSLPAAASSHMDAPLISLDDSANTTDVYAFKSSSGGVNYLTTALAVYPFEEPGIGPNNYRFDPTVDYDIHVALGSASIAAGRADLTYRFEFSTTYANTGIILQSYLGVVTPGTQAGPFPANQNLRQIYKLTKIDHRPGGATTVLVGAAKVPPNNQGLVTPDYNEANNGNNVAKGGVNAIGKLDGFTRMGVRSLANNYLSFAGQRDDGFYADIQSIFDLDFGFAKPAAFDSQGGYNVHTIALNIPQSELGTAQIAGVYATTSRNGVQVGRQGNPLFVEAFIGNIDKDKYNATSPATDAANFTTYAASPQLASVLGSTPPIPGLLQSIFIPDLIKVDMTTPPARLAGNPGFHRLSVFGGDVLQSTFQDPFNNGGLIPGGWPNGRRFGDDVIDIGIIALGAAPAAAGTDVDKVTTNDVTYNTVFPYAATPHNGRNHGHH